MTVVTIMIIMATAVVMVMTVAVLHDEVQLEVLVRLPEVVLEEGKVSVMKLLHKLQSSNSSIMIMRLVTMTMGEIIMCHIQGLLDHHIIDYYIIDIMTIITAL